MSEEQFDRLIVSVWEGTYLICAVICYSAGNWIFGSGFAVMWLSIHRLYRRYGKTVTIR